MPELTAEALGMEQVPPGAVTFANRAWSARPGLLLALVQFSKALQADSPLDKITATKLVMVTSAINGCLY